MSQTQLSQSNPLPILHLSQLPRLARHPGATVYPFHVFPMHIWPARPSPQTISLLATFYPVAFGCDLGHHLLMVSLDDHSVIPALAVPTVIPSSSSDVG